MWDDSGKAHLVTAAAGVDQGCPLSPLLFALGLAEALQEIASRLEALDASAKLFACLDEVVVVVPQYLDADRSDQIHTAKTFLEFTGPKGICSGRHGPPRVRCR